MRLKRTDDEINKVIQACWDQDDEGESRWPRMTYEQGVAEALRWAIGETDDHPMDE